MTQPEVTAKALADAAHAGDETALRVWDICGEYLGRGLSVLIDLLNPQRIVLGSIFARSGDLLRPAVERIIGQEALRHAAACCRIVPAQVGKGLGLTVIALTGASGGRLKEIADICICVPETETYRVQELHLPVYHCLCAEVEGHFYGA